MRNGTYVQKDRNGACTRESDSESRQFISWKRKKVRRLD